MDLIILIPCLNEEKNISKVTSAIPKHIDGINKIDVLVIDDGSTDKTAEVVRGLKNVSLLQHKYNQGVGKAFHSGIKYAEENGYDIAVNMDGDGQFLSEDIPKLTKLIMENRADFVSGSRFLKAKGKPQNMSYVKYFGNKMMTGLIGHLARKKFHDVSCGFRAYSKEAMLNLNLHGKFTYTQESFLDFADKGMRIAEVPISVKYSKDRKSRVANNIFSYALKTSKIIFRTYRDFNSLKFFWTLSLFFLILSSCFMGFLLHWYANNGKFSPHIWSGLVGGFFFLISLSFFIVGLFTDMLDRIRRNQEKILYLIKRNSVKKLL